MNAVEVRNAYKHFKLQHENEVVLSDFSMTVPAGSIYCLLGASGCGKTTLFSCILGMQPLNSGTIKVLGEKVSHDHPIRCINSIGFVPQNLSLSPIMTVEETLNFFANISLMDMKLFKERFELLNEILELPSNNKFIQNLSGGEKRKLSLAVAMIHDPILLILDESTVGLDVIIRNQIWNFFRRWIVQNKNFSVLMSTHYPTEAENADLCGFMRNGKLLIENKPNRIISTTNSINLHEALFVICNEENGYIQGAAQEADSIPFENEESIKVFNQRKVFEYQTLMALFVKKIQLLKRSKIALAFTFIYPIMQLFMLIYTIGRPPTDLAIGIFNQETINCSLNLQNTTVYDCKSEGLSCKFIDQIPEKTFTKKFYTTFEDAMYDARKGKTVGFLDISSNFSVNLMQLQRFKRKSKLTGGAINIYLDNSNKLLYGMILAQLNDAYYHFIYKIMPFCNHPPKFYVSQLNISDLQDELIHIDLDIRLSIIPSLYLIFIIAAANVFFIFSIDQYISENIWNRILLSGVTVLQIMMIEIFMCIILTLAYIAQTILARIILLQFTSYQDFMLTISMVVLVSVLGSSFAILLEIILTSFSAVSVTCIAIIFTLSVSGGVLTPIEGMQFYLKSFMLLLPTGLPVISYRNAVIKGLEFSHPSVFTGFILLIIWNILIIFLCTIRLKFKRYL